MSYSDRIKPDGVSILGYLEDLLRKDYQVPTFQREVEWEEKNVKKLWDSIYKFYPIGSLLIWLTDLQLKNHREIGGHIIADENFVRTEYQYILDGQQRTTALLTSIYGGKIEGREDFDPVLYIDLSVEDKNEIDDESYKERFLFWDEIDDRNGELKKNTKRKKRYDESLIVKLRDVKENYAKVEEEIQSKPEYSDYKSVPRAQLRKIREVLDNYRISLIELKGVKVSEVCQIFERINREGKALDIFDIVVAKTFQPKTQDSAGFYLRELIDSFKKSKEGSFMEVADLTYLQILAVLIKISIPDSDILNITDVHLSRIQRLQIEKVWKASPVESGKSAILKTFDFFENHLLLKGPQLIPYRYFYLTLSSYFFENTQPDYEFVKQYFWYYSFHKEDLLSNTTDLWKHVEFLNKAKNKEKFLVDSFLIDKNDLRSASYSSQGRLSRGLLSLFSNQDPRDWENPDRRVWSDTYYHLTDKPNLHHVFPLDYIEKNPGTNKLSSNSLMNIVYLTQITNLQISNEPPLRYIKKFDNKRFEEILPNHLLPLEILTWAREDKAPNNSLDYFIEKRIDKIINKLKEKITFCKFDIIDTKTSN